MPTSRKHTRTRTCTERFLRRVRACACARSCVPNTQKRRADCEAHALVRLSVPVYIGQKPHIHTASLRQNNVFITGAHWPVLHAHLALRIIARATALRPSSKLPITASACPDASSCAIRHDPSSIRDVIPIERPTTPLSSCAAARMPAPVPAPSSLTGLPSKRPPSSHDSARQIPRQACAITPFYSLHFPQRERERERERERRTDRQTDTDR